MKITEHNNTAIEKQTIRHKFETMPKWMYDKNGHDEKEMRHGSLEKNISIICLN